MTNKVVVLVTCGSFGEARRIARDLVDARLAACVNVLESPVRSTYRWKGEVESATEYLLLVKSSAAQFGGIRRRVEQLHSYDLPEVIALPILRGSRAYLGWIASSVVNAPAAVRPTRKAPRRRAS